jgi:hypothetical protein
LQSKLMALKTIRDLSESVMEYRSDRFSQQFCFYSRKADTPLLWGI